MYIYIYIRIIYIYIYIFVTIKTMCPTGYHHSGFVGTHALGHIMYMNISIHITPILLL